MWKSSMRIDKNTTILEQATNTVAATTRRGCALFTFVLRRLVAIQHLGLGELPLMRASAKERSNSHSLFLSLPFYFSRNKRAGEKDAQTDKRGKREGETVTVGGAGATTSRIICDVSPKRPNLQSSFLHIESWQSLCLFQHRVIYWTEAPAFYV